MEREGFQMNTIAERIKYAMKAKNKKQVDIVKDTGISKGAFSSYLSGQYNPKADKMELIADSLDVDLRWLYGQNVPMEHTSQNDNALQYVFYNNSCSEYLLDDLDDIYIAMMTQYAALIPRFYVLVNRAGNAMHILPLFLKEDSTCRKCVSSTAFKYKLAKYCNAKKIAFSTHISNRTEFFSFSKVINKEQKYGYQNATELQ